MKRLMGMLLLGMLAVPVFAEVPKLINYSGKIMDKQGIILEDKDYDMIFTLWGDIVKCCVLKTDGIPRC